MTDKPPHNEDAMLARLYREGWSLTKISRMTGLGREQIRRRLKAAGVQMRPKGRERKEWRNSRIVRAYARGKKTLQRLAMEHGISRQRVHQIVKEAENDN